MPEHTLPAQTDPETVAFVERCWRMIREAGCLSAELRRSLYWKVDHARYLDLLAVAPRPSTAIEYRPGDEISPLWIFGLPVLTRPHNADELELVLTDRPRP